VCNANARTKGCFSVAKHIPGNAKARSEVIHVCFGFLKDQAVAEAEVDGVLLVCRQGIEDVGA
jgi:hypothetical protein